MNDDDRAAFQFTTSGCRTLADNTLRMTIDIEPRDAADAFAIFGQRGILGAIAPLVQRTDSLESAAGDSATVKCSWPAELYRHGFLMSDAVLRALAPEDEYKAHVQAMECANCGQQDYDGVNADGRVVYCHVRRAGEAGTGYKPAYRAIPLCERCHRRQHQRGESSLAIDCDAILRKTLEGWAHGKLREALGVTSLRQATVSDLRAWCEKHDIPPPLWALTGPDRGLQPELPEAKRHD